MKTEGAAPVGLDGAVYAKAERAATVKKANFIGAFLLMLPKFARVSPALFAVFCLVCFLHGIARAAIVPATQYFLERAADFAVRKTTLPDVAAGLALLCLAHVCRQLVHGAHHILMLMYWRKAEGALSLEIHGKINRVAPIAFEETQTLDGMNKAVKGKDEAVWFTGSTVTGIFFYTPYFTFMAVYLANINPMLMCLLALIFAPTLLAHVVRAKVFAKAEDRAAPIRREFDYYEQCLTGREYFKETRVLGAFAYFKKLYADALSLLNKLDFNASAKASAAELFAKLLSLFGYIGILLMMFGLLMKGGISVGAFAAILSSLEMVFSLMREMIIDNLGESAKNLGRVQNYLNFLQMPERGGVDTDVQPGADIVLAGVSFSYPGAGQKAVDDVTLTLRDGETVAVVGENGSGKTTLVRLITGLYLPDEGDVLYGRANTKTASAISIFKRISAVFQKYQRYQMTLRDNIRISSMEDADNKMTGGVVAKSGAATSGAVVGAVAATSGAAEANYTAGYAADDASNGTSGDAALDAICVQAGIDMDDGNFTDGYDTMLSREFDGVDLSGGQWQRIAIARSFFRPHRLIVLDEPTAAIDPIEETRIYNRFVEITNNKTAVIVTHRLGSVKLADRILVMWHGRLVEQGTHSELMSVNGEYARLYKSQEQWYVS